MRPVSGKGVSGTIRLDRNKNQKDGRATRTGDDGGPLKQRPGEASPVSTLHRKIPDFFFDKAEELLQRCITDTGWHKPTRPSQEASELGFSRRWRVCLMYHEAVTCYGGDYGI